MHDLTKFLFYDPGQLIDRLISGCKDDVYFFSRSFCFDSLIYD